MTKVDNKEVVKITLMIMFMLMLIPLIIKYVPIEHLFFVPVKIW